MPLLIPDPPALVAPAPLVRADVAFARTGAAWKAWPVPRVAAPMPFGPWKVCPPLSEVHPADVVDVRCRDDIPAEPAGGKHYVVRVPHLDVGDLVLGGPRWEHSWLRGDIHGTAGLAYATFPVLSGSRITIAGPRIGLRGLCISAIQIYPGTGATNVQIEACWFADYNDSTGYSVGCIRVDKEYNPADHWLIAFNRYSKKSATQIINCFMRWNAPGATTYLHRVSTMANWVLFRNHMHGLQTGPSGAVKAGDSGRTRFAFIGDGFKEADCDLRQEWIENLVTQHDAVGPFTENKFTGIRMRRNTLEHGTLNDPGGAVGGHQPLQIRIRGGRVTKDGTVAPLTGVGSVIEDNLWVWPSGYSQQTSVNLRDGFHKVTNCRALVLGSGVQPTSGSTVYDPTADADKFDIQLLAGSLDWTGFPENEASLTTSTKWANAGKCCVGGNDCRVIVGMATTPSIETLSAADNVVIGGGGTRKDRNRSVYTASGQGAGGTIRSVRTDGTTDLTPLGADIGKVLHRMRAVENGFTLAQVEVGPGGWSAGFY